MLLTTHAGFASPQVPYSTPPSPGPHRCKWVIWVPEYTPAKRKFIGLLGHKSPLTRQLDGVNTTGQIEKRFTVQVSGTELVDTGTEG
jgi:hypothetical protein